MKKIRVVSLLLIVSLILISSLVVANKGVLIQSSSLSSLYFSVGNYYASQQDWQEAQHYFEKAINENTEFKEAYHDLGIVLHKQKNDLAAFEALLQAISIDDTYKKAHNSAGLLYFKQGEYDNAISHLEKASVLDADDVQIQFDLAVSYVERFREKESKGTIENADLADLEKGLAHYENALALDPHYPHAKENAAIVESVLSYYRGN